MSAALALLGIAGGLSPAAAQPVTRAAEAADPARVYLTRDQALAEIFPDADRVVRDRWELSATQRATIRERSRTEVPRPTPLTFRLFDGEGGMLGYAMQLEVRGKYRPITFMAGLKPDFTVKGVEVMIYREDRGYEVRRSRFLRQYRGKSGEAPIRTHRDIMNITGATISVRSMNAGVRRALATLDILYGGEGAPRRASRSEEWTLTGR